MYSLTRPQKLALLLTLPLVLLVVELISALRVVHSAPQEITNSATFVQEFDPTSKQPITSREPFDIRFAGLFWPSSDTPHTYSPIIPYRPLQESWVQSGGCQTKSNESGDSITTGEHRAIYTDPLWKLSWIFVSPCHQEFEYFGPFRFAPTFK